DREVAPPCVTYPVAAKRDLRSSPESLGILTQRRDLERMRIYDERNRAMVDSCRHAFDARRFRPARHFLRQRGCRDIDIADRHVEERVSHRTADHARFLAVTVEQLKCARGRTGLQPRRM